MACVVVVGIDSASTSGWASLNDERPIAYGAVDARNPRLLDDCVRNLCALARPDRVVIEDSYLGRGPKSNVNTVKVLARIQGMWLMAFAMRGLTAEIILPAAWQSGILAGLIGKRTKSKECKKAAALWVRATHKLVVPEDVADAIGIATFVARRELVALRCRPRE